MKPLNKSKANISSELTHAQQTTVNNNRTKGSSDSEFFGGIAHIAERLWEGKHEEDILAIQALENAYCESKAEMEILMGVLFLNKDVTRELLDLAKRCMPEQKYQFLINLLSGFIGLSEGDETFPMSPDNARL